MKRIYQPRWEYKTWNGLRQCQNTCLLRELEHMRDERETLVRLLESVKRNRANYEGRNRSGVAA